MFKSESWKTAVVLALVLTTCCLSGCRCRTRPPLPEPPEISEIDRDKDKDLTTIPDTTGRVDSSDTGIMDMPRLDSEVEEVEVPELRMVHFDYDQAELTPASQEILKENTKWLIENMEDYDAIKVEGHCDERGTNKYNMVLGERRANSVKEFLVKEGIPASLVVSVSYGEERPLSPGHSENDWAMNRRAEFRIIIEK